MQRGSILRWLLFALAIFLFFQFGIGSCGGSNERQPLGASDTSFAETRREEKTCAITGPRFTAELSSHGGSLRHFRLTDPKYKVSGGDAPIDLVDPLLREGRMPLRTDLRVP